MREITIFLILNTILLSANIKGIVYRGKDISPFMLLNKGDEFSEWKLFLSVNRAYSTGEFSNIIVEKKETTDGIILTVKATEKEKIKKIETYCETKGIKLPSLFHIRKGKYYSESDILEEENRIKNWLRTNGFLSPEIKHSFKNGVLKFTIKPGLRYKIRKIIFNGKKLAKIGWLKVGNFYFGKDVERTKKFLLESLRKKNYLRGEVIITKKISGDSIEINIEEKKGKKFHIKIKGKGYTIPPEIIYPYWEKEYSKEWALEEGKTSIKDYLIEHGVFVQEISACVEEMEDAMEIVYELKGIKKLKRRKIIFKGNKFFTSDYLKKLIPGRVGIFPKFNLQNIRDGILNIREAYLKKGFKDVVVQWAPSENGIIIKITEGKRYTISEILFSGNISISSKEIIKVLELDNGDPFYPFDLYMATQRVKSLYLQKGFRKTEVTYRSYFNGENVRVELKIKEGIRPRLSLVYITGLINKKGKSIIKRNFPVKLGEPLDASIVEKGRIALEASGVFTLVEIKENIWDDKHTDLIIKAEQLPSTTYSFGIGWEERGGPRMTFDISFRNKPISPLILNFGAQIGGVEKIVGLTGEMPNYFQEWDLRSSMSYERGDMTGYSFEMENIIFSLSRRKENFWDQLSFRWSKIELLNLQSPLSDIDREFFPVFLTSLSYVYTIDKRDDPINPEDGWFFNLSAEKYLAFFGTRVDGLKTYVHFQQYRGSEKTILAMGFKLGLAKGNLPLRERFFAGGSMSFRGADIDMLSPLTKDKKMPVGGKGLALANIELRVKLMENIQAVVFYDGGEVTRLMKELSFKKWQNAFGLGIRYKTPFGPIRLEMGYNPNPAVGKKLRFFISLGEIL